MIKHYSDAEIADFKEFYEEHGVVRLPGLVGKEWVDRILATIDEVSALSDAPRKEGQSLNFGKADGRMTIRHMWREIDTIREFMLQSELAEPLARIIGSKQLRFWFDLTFIHNGAPDGENGAGTGWHHDVAAFPFKGDQLGSLWMAMTPSSAERSRLMFIDKSHKTAEGLYVTDLMKTQGLLPTPDFDTLVREGKENIITWDCEPGDAIILHPYVIHGASGNKGNFGRRVAITTRWIGDDVRFYPTPGATSSGTVGVDTDTMPIGAKPRSEFLPLVWPPQDAAKTGARD